jgi:hypothetical protein
MKLQFMVMLMMVSVVLAACAPPPPANAPSSNPIQPQASPESFSVPTVVSQPQAAETPVVNSDAPHTSDVDLTHLELGDGKYSPSPQVGYVFSCQTRFNFSSTGGQGQDGIWLNGDSTWDATRKAVVDGSVTWPHSFTITVQGDQRAFVGNDLPNHPTGNYPIASSDDAYIYDRNPNSISAQTVSFGVPVHPVVAPQPTCVGGEVGIMLSGVVIFSAFDADGRDAPAHEVQDECDGHPQVSGFYHYHSLSDCLEDTASGHSALLGYAFDGFGIYGYYGEDGRALTNQDLDECHGHTHMIEWDGVLVEMYHYHATHEFPYIVGCFKGTPSVRALSAGNEQGDQPQQGGGGSGQPPQEAINACVGLSQGASCSVGPTTGTCQMPPNTTQLACVPGGGPPP